MVLYGLFGHPLIMWFFIRKNLFFSIGYIFMYALVVYVIYFAVTRGQGVVYVGMYLVATNSPGFTPT